MRPVLMTDLSIAARALLAVPAPKRETLAQTLVHHADLGDRYTRKLHRMHQVFGDGTLASAARQCDLAAEPTLDDWAYCECVQLVLQALMRHKQQGQQANM